MGILDDILGIRGGSPSDRVITPDPTRVAKPKIDLYSPHGYRREQPMLNIPGRRIGLEDPNHPAFKVLNKIPMKVKPPRTADITSLAPHTFAQYGDEDPGGTSSSPEAITALLRGAGAMGPVKPKGSVKPKAPPQSFLSKALGFDDKSGKSSYLTELGLRMASRKDKKGPLSFLTDPLLETYTSQAKKETAAAKFGLEKQRTWADVMTANAAMEKARANARAAGTKAEALRRENAIKAAMRLKGYNQDDLQGLLAAEGEDAVKEILMDAQGIYDSEFKNGGNVGGGSTGKPYTAVGTGTTGIPR